MEYFSHLLHVAVSAPVCIKKQKGHRKIYFFLPLLFCCHLSLAQFKQEVALHRTTIPHTATVASSPVTPKSVAASARHIMSSLKGKLSKITAAPKSNELPIAEKIVLQADRLDEEHIMVYWNGATAGNPTTYIIERRFGDPHGAFDSVGTVTSRSTDPAAQGYRLVDKNAFKGSTFYRLRQAGEGEKGSAKTSVMVSGNNRGLQVSTAPALGGTITVTLSKFKIAPRTHLYITDAHGSLVYQKKNVFFSTGHTIELTGVQLPRGTYQIEVTNHYNTGVNTLVIR